MQTLAKFARIAAISLMALSPLTVLQAADSATEAAVGQSADDSALAAKVKAALATDAEVATQDVQVNADKGAILLTGSVKQAAQVERAIQLASAVQGVKSVDSKLTLKAY